MVGEWWREAYHQRSQKLSEPPQKFEMHSLYVTSTFLRSHSLSSFASSSFLLLLPPSTLRSSKKLQFSPFATSSPIPPNETKFPTQGFSHSCKNSNDSLESLARISNWKFPLAPIAHSNLSVRLLKFMMLFGFLTLKHSYPAHAASDFSSAFSLSPEFGDFDDISTGFASVRKISLPLF